MPQIPKGKRLDKYYAIPPRRMMGTTTELIFRHWHPSI